MGISGLLPFLKDATTTIHIKQFEGATVAVDTYCWIYRGAFSCAEDLAMGHPTDGHVKYVLKYVKKLLEWNIKPIMVFDGSCLPSKKMTELKRKESKEMYRNKARQCLSEGRVNEARECFQRCIECTPKMALEVIKACHDLGVDVVVAPYEADAQLTYLNKIDVAQIVITEDSDLVLFGCEKILYKLDINGNGQLIEKEKIISITQFDSANSFEKFRWMCILSGCDYLENLPGIGLGKAKKFLKAVQKTDIEQLLKQMPKVLKMPNLVISNEYIEKFKKADKTFKYQIVFDPLKRKLVSLHEYQSDIGPDEDITFAGIFYDDEQALQHSLGNLDVNSHSVVYDFNPESWNYKAPLKFSANPPAHMRSVWSKHYKTFKSSNPFSSFFSASKVKSESQPIARPLTVGKSRTMSTTFTVTTTNTMKDTRRKSSGALSSQMDSNSKRKFESITEVKTEELVFTIDSSSEASSSSYPSSSLSSEDVQSADDKRARMEHSQKAKVDIDELLTQYSSQTESQVSKLTIETSPSGFESSSSYFSSSACMSVQTNSPILTSKSSQKFSQSRSSQASQGAPSLSVFSKDTNQAGKFVTKAKNEPNTNSPLRLKIIEDLAGPMISLETGGDSDEACQDSQPAVAHSDLLRKFSSSTSSFRFQKERESEENRQKTASIDDSENKENLGAEVRPTLGKLVLESLESMDPEEKSPIVVGSSKDPIMIIESSPPLNKPAKSSSAKKPPTKQANTSKKPADANSRPITEFFSKFQFTKTSNPLQSQ